MVTERTQEIGLMKALGATNRRILMQFFLEGVFLTALSGGIGHCDFRRRDGGAGQAANASGI